MDIKEVVEHFGNATKMGAALGVTEQSVRNWVKANKIPAMVQLAISHVTKGKFKSD